MIAAVVSGRLVFQHGGIGAICRPDPRCGCPITAKVDRNLLLRIAELVYQQTSADGAGAKLPPAPGKPS